MMGVMDVGLIFSFFLFFAGVVPFLRRVYYCSMDARGEEGFGMKDGWIKF